MTLEAMLTQIKASGLRLTPQRVAICRVLSESHEHPTASQIYEQLQPQMPSLSLMTVYNNLNALVNAGVINTLGSAGDDQVHYDADHNPHINLACVTCHQIVDLPSESIQRIQQEVNAASDYRLFGVRVLFYGLCPLCQQGT